MCPTLYAKIDDGINATCVIIKLLFNELNINKTYSISQTNGTIYLYCSRDSWTSLYIDNGSTATSSAIGESVSTDDITVTAHYTDDTSANVTDLALIDASNVNAEMQGEYSILITYTENGITCNTSIAYNITETPVPSEWDDEITLERAWQTDQYFPKTNIGRIEANTSYNIKFEAICESTSTINGSLIFKLSNGQMKNVGTVTNEIFSVDWDFVSDKTLPDVKLLAYTADGSGFPWTVKIKNFTIS